ncbi:MAG TPA: hypothetical protein VI455_05575 [Terriglobia bacterium]
MVNSPVAGGAARAQASGVLPESARKGAKSPPGRFRPVRAAAVLLCCAAASVLPAAATGPAQESAATSAGDPAARLTYTRTLAGSVPEYLSVSVNSDGTGVYEGGQVNEARPRRPLKLSPATTEKLFALTAELNDFRSLDVDSHKKVANLGLKTLTYERGGEKNQIQFNFTQQRTARDLMDLFEGVANVEEAVGQLEYGIKYDPLSLPQQLLNIQIALNHNELVDPELMVPSLEQILSNGRFLHVAQVRAQDILKTVGQDK